MRQSSSSNDETGRSASAGDSSSLEPRRLVDHFFRHEYAKLVAALTHRFGVRNWELVEDVVQSALHRALRSWSLKGVPDNPSAWLHRVAGNLAIDALRRDSRWSALPESADEERFSLPPESTPGDMQDEQLRMMFVCCHPQVPSESQIALALKTLCGFGNREIARALLATEVSVAKRITRAKQKLRQLRVEPVELDEASLRERLPDVQSVIYLLFNEGFSSSQTDKLIRDELCEEAVRLALLLSEHPMTSGPDSAALMSLLLFHAARLDARLDDNGAILLLKEQDRGMWDSKLLRAAFVWLQRATVGETVSRYHAEAWIAAEHCRAATFEQTNWSRIAQGYDLLCQLAPSPVHELNRAIAIGRRDGPAAGLRAFQAIEPNTQASEYYLWHATHGELARQNGDLKTAREALGKAWKLAPTQAEKELICRKIDRCGEVVDGST